MQQRLAQRLGMRRIHVVRVVIDEAGTRAEVSGIAHRLPRTVPVPVGTAVSLAAEGVPLWVRRATAGMGTGAAC